MILLLEAATTILLLSQRNQAADHLINGVFGKFNSKLPKT
jgi:hypothetical protein